MKIALIKETKIPQDNRVILSPAQVKEMMEKYPEHEWVVESSDIRAYSDDEYRAQGVEVVTETSDCDILFGIKEPKISSLHSDKHYFSFGHIAKEQIYNRPLAKAFIDKNITFTDYEYLTDENGVRVCAFGWWAGIVGTYYTLQGYGLRYNLFKLKKPDLKFTLDELKSQLQSVELPKIKIVITGTGRVSQGAQFILNEIGARQLTREQFLSDESVDTLSYFVADLPDLVYNKDNNGFELKEFFDSPEKYRSRFMELASHADVLLSCHFWNPAAPVYLTQDDLRDPNMKIKVIGDISCDINGSIKSTLRPSTHAAPFYDYNPETGKEEPAFSNPNNITVMAVDTCPNALARDTSEYFGSMLIDNVFESLLGNGNKDLIKRATIIENGSLTPHYSYLQKFVEG